MDWAARLHAGLRAATEAVGGRGLALGERAVGGEERGGDMGDGEARVESAVGASLSRSRAASRSLSSVEKPKLAHDLPLAISLCTRSRTI
jgi:hypothetical protein